MFALFHFVQAYHQYKVQTERSIIPYGIGNVWGNAGETFANFLVNRYWIPGQDARFVRLQSSLESIGRHYINILNKIAQESSYPKTKSELGYI